LVNLLSRRIAGRDFSKTETKNQDSKNAYTMGVFYVILDKTNIRREVKTMICEKCGAKMPDDFVACGKCGSALSNKLQKTGIYGQTYDIFLSYRREGGETTAILLRDRLTAKGYVVFLDIESLASGSFNEKLLDVINDCNDVVVICSKGALDRCSNDGDWVRREIAHAFAKNKNIVPIMLRGFEWPSDLPEDIKTLANQNGINANNSEFFDAAIDRLCDKFLTSMPKSNAPPIKPQPIEKVKPAKVPKEPKERSSMKIKTIAASISCIIIAAALFFAVKGLTVPNEPAPNNAPDVTANALVTAPVDTVPDAPTVPETKETIPDAPKTDAPVSAVPESKTETKEPEPEPAVIETKPEPEPETVPEAPVTYTAEEIYAMNGDAVFMTDRKHPNGSWEHGTGFFISSDGLAMTAYHVMAYPDPNDINYETFGKIDNFSIVLANGNKLDFEEIIYANAEQDIVIFKVKNPNNQVFPYLKLNTTDTPQQNDEIFTMGCVQTENPYLNEGTVYGLLRDLEFPQEDGRIKHVKNKLAIKAATYDGNSGGPVLNNKNQVVGLIFAGDSTKPKDEPYTMITRLTPIDELIKGLLP